MESLAERTRKTTLVMCTGIYKGRELTYIPADYLLFIYTQPWLKVPRYKAIFAYIQNYEEVLKEEVLVMKRANNFYRSRSNNE